MSSTYLKAGLADPVLGSQDIFRTVLDAMARPGDIHQLAADLDPPSPLMPATAAMALTLFDASVSVFNGMSDPQVDLEKYLGFHTGCRFSRKPEAAAFALVENLGDLSGYSYGTPEYPDRSTTLIVQVSAMRAGDGVRLTGPGIKDEHFLEIDGLTELDWQALKANATLFPQGLDFIFVAGDQVVCLPRSTQVEA